jgi:hypothetical protein
LDGDIGTNSGARAEFYQPVGKVPSWLSFGSAPYFTYINAAFKKEHDPVLVGDDNEVPFEKIPEAEDWAPVATLKIGVA